jgi:hypothetical protein
MPNTAPLKQYLKEFDFKSLFIKELGWDRHEINLTVTADGKSYALSAVAHKRGMAAFVCPSKNGIPQYSERRKIERQVTKSAHEHIIIFTNNDKTIQIWQWVKREPGKPTACREHHFDRNQSGEALAQKLIAIAFSLEEEEQISLVDVTLRARVGFDVEKVTKKFYDRFKTEHDSFLKFLKGIPDEELKKWYASVMINRLMFIYFIQKKGFLNSDQDYLRTKLKESKQQGKDRYFAEFLSPLFFEGFAKKETERSGPTNKLLGTVPYLNGGLFLKHQIEETYGKSIEIADNAFQKVFDFFEQYQWHLDERPLRKDNEINPDVLGYIFEKYINQKQMGAYYTKEDITEYISKNTIIPFLFDEAKKKCKIAFEGGHSVWNLLQSDPDRYIYDAVKYGAGNPLPKNIEAGVKDVSKRREWNKPAPEDFALPTEIWREVVARRKRYEEIRSKLANGDVREINDLITYNLNIRQFAQDVIETSEGPDLLNAFWNAIEKVTVLDPTCGSGAFLFAALNVLEPLYEACLDRMEAFLDEWGDNSKQLHPNYHKHFSVLRARLEEHPNERYFILKSIIVNNLFGVDIMEEATEICKLRLFLKLVAQIEDAKKIEPLPDIDFNIRAGNTLVGFATYEEVEHAVTSKLDFGDAMKQINETAEDLDEHFKMFRQQQTELGGTVAAKDKERLLATLHNLEQQLNRHLSTNYGVGTKKGPGYDAWLRSHRPFHWFIQFYGIMKEGGFDVLIGNPPYVEYKDVKDTYAVIGYKTIQCGDLYAYVLERSYRLVCEGGSLGAIVPISIFGTDGFDTLQKETLSKVSELWISHFANRPSQLFDGAQKRLTILVGKRGVSEDPLVHTTAYQRWRKEERVSLFSTRLHYSEAKSRYQVFPASLEKLGNELQVSIFGKILKAKRRLASMLIEKTRFRVYYTRKFGYFLAFLDFVPGVEDLKTGKLKAPSELKDLGFASNQDVHSVIAVLTSSTFFWFWNVLSDCRNVNRRDLLAFPIMFNREAMSDISIFASLGEKYLAELKRNSGTMIKSGLRLQTFEYTSCKPIIDEIDRVLGKHYGFTEEELDFIINYDIKYRMGKDSAEEEE